MPGGENISGEEESGGAGEKARHVDKEQKRTWFKTGSWNSEKRVLHTPIVCRRHQFGESRKTGRDRQRIGGVNPQIQAQIGQLEGLDERGTLAGESECTETLEVQDWEDRCILEPHKEANRLYPALKRKVVVGTSHPDFDVWIGTPQPTNGGADEACGEICQMGSHGISGEWSQEKW